MKSGFTSAGRTIPQGPEKVAEKSLGMLKGVTGPVGAIYSGSEAERSKQ